MKIKRINTGDCVTTQRLKKKKCYKSLIDSFKVKFLLDTSEVGKMFQLITEVSQIKTDVPITLIIEKTENPKREKSREKLNVQKVSVISEKRKETYLKS